MSTEPEITEITINVPNPTEVCEWADDNAPGLLEEIVCREIEDGRYLCRLRMKSADEAVALKVVFDGQPG